MIGAIPPLPNTSSWSGAQFQESTGTTLLYFTLLYFTLPPYALWAKRLKLNFVCGFIFLLHLRFGKNDALTQISNTVCRIMNTEQAVEKDAFVSLSFFSLTYTV
jgi:hypothetical protein